MKAAEERVPGIAGFFFLSKLSFHSQIMAGRGISGEFPEWGRVPIFCHSLELPRAKNGIRSRTGGSKFARLMKFAILRK